MFAYVLRRLLYMPLILLGVIFITFVLFEMTSTPEAQARSHMGEKASPRQVYDWLESRGLIAWTESGEVKIAAIADNKLSPKQAQFVSEKSIVEIPEDIEETAAKASDLQEDVTDLLEDNDVSDNDWADAAKTKMAELAEFFHLESKSDEAFKKAGKADTTVPVFLLLASLEAQIEHLQEVAKKQAGRDKDEIEEFDDLRAKQGKLRNKLIKLKQRRDATISGARSELVTLKLGPVKSTDHESSEYKAAMKEAEGKITKMPDISPDFTYTSFFTKFKVYLTDIVTLNFGNTRDSRSVMGTIYEGMWPSLALTLPAFLLAELIGVFFGLFAAMYRQTKIDTTIIVSSILLMSINGIALIMFGQKFIAADLNYFPVQGYMEGIGAIRFLALPIFLYIVMTFGERIRFNRIVMLDETNQDYVRTARAKGLGENTVLFKHIFRNTLIPLITRWAVAIPSLYLGSLVLESFFSIPGLGYMTVDAIRNSDVNVIRAVVVFGSISFMIANLVSDVLYAVADPRVKLS